MAAHTSHSSCPFFRYPSIEAFPTAMKQLTTIARGRPYVEYIGHPKIHGTNCAIVNSSVFGLYAQSRNRVITPSDDHLGFAAYVSSQSEFYTRLIDRLNVNIRHHKSPDEYKQSFDTTILYGEWCGQGIQKDVAVAGVSPRFIVFDVCLISTDEPTIQKRWLRPPDINELGIADRLHAPEHLLWNIFLFPTYHVSVDVADPKQSYQNDIEPILRSVVEQCPVGQYFGVEGPGEGLVWSTREPPHHRMKTKVDTWRFQFASDDTTVTTMDKPAQRVQRFVDIVVTDDRLQQAEHEVIYEHNREFTRTYINAFTKWVIDDIEKEHKDLCETTFAVSFKRCKKDITKRVRQWYMERLQKHTQDDKY